MATTPGRGTPPRFYTFPRRAKGFSQSQLARAAGVAVGSLGNWEQDIREPSLGMAWRLSQALGVSLDEFVGPNPKFREKAKKGTRGKKRKGE